MEIKPQILSKNKVDEVKYYQPKRNKKMFISRKKRRNKKGLNNFLGELPIEPHLLHVFSL